MPDPVRIERPLWLSPNGWTVEVLDQTLLPGQVRIARLRSLKDAAQAIVSMQVRGAPLIGVTAAYGVALAMRSDPSDSSLATAYDQLIHTRPTAVNLRWALDQMQAHLSPLPPAQRSQAAYLRAAELADEDARINRQIGEHGLQLFRQILARKPPGTALQVMTHCNAGRIATIEWGTATAPIYLAHSLGIPIHVWVSETRPRIQGAALTAWELGERGVPLTLIPDNSAGHLIQRGLVDLVIVGADRVTASGDAANKIGTYLKALAAAAHKVPFYVAFPGTTIDWTLRDGIAEIPIEQRSAREVTHVAGMPPKGRRVEVAIAPPDTAARNDAFDVTPAKLITSFITERGLCSASARGLAGLYPDQARSSTRSVRARTRR